MFEIIKIIKKDFKLLFRSKSSVLTLLLGPLVLILIVGLAFNNVAGFKVKIGFYFPEYTEISGDILTALEEKYIVQLYDRKSNCINSVKLGETNICMIFENTLDVSSNMDNEITIYVDYSEYNLAWMVVDTVSSEVQKTSQNLTKSLAAILLEKIERTQENLIENQPKLNNITGSADNIAGYVDSIQTNLGKQALSIDKSKFKTDDILKTVEKIDERVTYLVDSINTKLDFMVKDMSDINLSDEEFEPISKLMSESSNEFETRKNQLSSQKDIVASYIHAMNTYITELEGNLAVSDSAKANSNNNVAKIKNELADIRSLVLELDTIFSTVNDEMSMIIVSNADSIAVPIKTKIEPMTSGATHLTYLFPAMLMLFIMYAGILLSAILVVKEKNSNAFLRNFMTPTKPVIFLLGSFFTSFSLIFMQLGIILFVAVTFLGLPIFDNFSNTIFQLLIAVTMFILFGMIFGYAFKNAESATLTAIFVSSIFLLMSGIIIPIESMPDYILAIAKYNPFLICETILKKILLYGYELKDLSGLVNILYLYIIISGFVIFLLQGLIKKIKASAIGISEFKFIKK
jgi:ABC-type multidrug transport system permease subunit/flagellar biosynthesis chaperone FliJ